MTRSEAELQIYLQAAEYGLSDADLQKIWPRGIPDTAPANLEALLAQAARAREPPRSRGRNLDVASLLPPPASTRRALDAQMAELRETADHLSREADSIFRAYCGIIERRQTTLESLEGLQAQQERLLARGNDSVTAERLASASQAIRAHPAWEFMAAKGPWLFFQTRLPVVVATPHGPVYLGRWLWALHLQSEPFRWTFACVRESGGSWRHPHVDSLGELCFGNARSLIAELAGKLWTATQRDPAQWAELLLQCMTVTSRLIFSCNQEEAWSRWADASHEGRARPSLEPVNKNVASPAAGIWAQLQKGTHPTQQQKKAKLAARKAPRKGGKK